MCLSRFVVFRVTFNNLCCCLLSRIHLSLMDQSWQTGSNEPCQLKVVFFTLLTSNWEVNSGCSLYSFISCILIKKIFVFSSYIEDIETNLPIGKA